MTTILTSSSQPIKQLWTQFQRPNVRDLAFALACPPVLADWGAHNSVRPIFLPSYEFWLTHFERYLPRLHYLEQHPAPLNRFLATQMVSQRLGFRFETLLTFWLLDTDYHDYQLLDRNIVLYRGKQTIGEIDFLILNKSLQAIEHWELSIKFYLAQPAVDAQLSTQAWVGLNRRDTLARKLDHLLTKQFRPTTVGDYKIDRRLAVIKGRFFVPDTIQRQDLPDFLSDTLLLSRWQDCLPQTPDSYRTARRVEWMTKRDFFDTFFQRHTTTVFSTDTSALWRTGLYFNLETNQPVLLDLQSSKLKARLDTES